MTKAAGATDVDALQEIARRLRRFATERDWEQFHSPKNLAMALTAEVGELVEHFQWVTEEESRNLPPEKTEQVRQELADVLLYLVRLADQLGVNLVQAAHEKVESNEDRYPVERARGSARKYTEL
jgi:NTP pyrophosphatase (non-canonical NTP hydrolase)